EVDGQTDVVTMGLRYLGPYSVNAALNPVLVVCLGLGYLFNLYRGKPVVREGGVVIMSHPCRNEFDSVQHPSYIDFFDEVLADTRDANQIEERYERCFAEDPWYRQLYRQSHAYHGVHPFYAWYWAVHAMEHVGDVIVVGREQPRLGPPGAGPLAPLAAPAGPVRALHPGGDRAAGRGPGVAGGPGATRPAGLQPRQPRGHPDPAGRAARPGARADRGGRGR